jgi:hypothetical protein
MTGAEQIKQATRNLIPNQPLVLLSIIHYNLLLQRMKIEPFGSFLYFAQHPDRHTYTVVQSHCQHSCCKLNDLRKKSVY